MIEEVEFHCAPMRHLISGTHKLPKCDIWSCGKRHSNPVCSGGHIGGVALLSAYVALVELLFLLRIGRVRWIDKRTRCGIVVRFPINCQDLSAARNWCYCTSNHNFDSLLSMAQV